MINMTIKEVLSRASNQLRKHKIKSYQLDSIVLLIDTLKVDKVFLYSHDNYNLSKNEFYEYQEKINRRIKREPIAYIIENKEFFGLNFRVNKNVLIPRPETELIVEYIINNISHNGSLLDICTGTGCIPISVKYHRKDIKVYLSDISVKALDIAIENYKTILKKDPIYYESDLFKNIPQKFKFDCISANPPYVKSNDISMLDIDIKNYEPLVALDGGIDGCNYYKNILDNAIKHLNPNGILIMEIDDKVYDNIKQYYEKPEMLTKWKYLEVIYDYKQIKRVLVLRRVN